ncbi:MAG: NAD(P)H-binding protein [Alphaproteobacteria bacterium]|nr:NAD(P)H-binding protein [Alphaproteobacteria bacterium]
MILVTCPGGKTGRAAIAALAAAGRPVRALVRREAAAEAALRDGAAETAAGDLADAAALMRAAKGCAAIYYIAPNMDPRERALGDNVIAAAKGAGARLVFHSVLHPQLEALPHHWQRHFVEQAIIESGVPFTILQPGSYMQNMLPGWAATVESGVHRMAYDVDAPMSLVDLDDIAAAAVRVLTDERFAHGIYELAGPAITLAEKAAVLTRVLGRDIRAEKQEMDAFLKIAAGHGASDYAQLCMARMMPHYDAHGLVGSPAVLGWLLGRPPTDFETFARRVAG